MLYFDANATTPCAPEVLEAMRPYWNTSFANASSPHRAGRVAAQAVAVARRAVAECLDARPHEIIFTSGATESTNLVFWGLLLAPRTRRHIVVSAIEHKAVLESAALLEEQGFEVTRLPVTPDGVVDLNIAARVITPETALVSVQAANNEIGTIQPILHIARLAHQAGAFFHVDAVQALGKMPVSMLDWECDFASFSAHKIYGPKGIGALFVKGGPMRWPWPRPLRGGGQEGGLRPGTLNVPGIVGFGAACEMLRQRPADILENIATLRDLLEKKMAGIYRDDIIIIGNESLRLPNTLTMVIKNTSAELILSTIKNSILGTSSACMGNSKITSHVLKALGFTDSVGENVIRISFLESTTLDEVSQFANFLQIAIDTARKMR